MEPFERRITLKFKKGEPRVHTTSSNRDGLIFIGNFMGFTDGDYYEVYNREELVSVTREAVSWIKREDKL